MQHDRAGVKRHEMKIRFAETPGEIAMAQRLRYHVFHDEMGASLQGRSGMDEDRFDPVADHLLVIEPAGETASEFPVSDGNLVGTYRLIRHQPGTDSSAFYSSGEYDLAPLLTRKPDLHFLELGRSCILQRCRGTAVIELLWQGIWDYVRQHKIDVMLGCASFEGIDPAAHKGPLSFLAQQIVTPPDWQVKAIASRYQKMDLVPRESYDAKRVLVSLPPLIKGYLRLGCHFGEGCVIDHDFNSVDVLIVLPVSAINPRYFARFGAPA
ncbi:GNAT family N-acetyltransferase [Aestuariivirga litoralis]|uniref:GNAT family N-acetyltransferase n=1 Tax=Aestuariivirga litoralis TaxID=2650924 RepID=UPI0018C72D40|nr:GNAT family N-acyltransferase [Aestuariivirga litoralis]MBG1233831.1 GNAT family N-acetyltransferase [Aestuariivirga litoralis]